MKIKDKITKQTFNVFSQSVIEQMLSNHKKYVEIKEQDNSSSNHNNTLEQDKTIEENQ